MSAFVTFLKTNNIICNVTRRSLLFKNICDENKCLQCRQFSTKRFLFGKKWTRQNSIFSLSIATGLLGVGIHTYSKSKYRYSLFSTPSVFAIDDFGSRRGGHLNFIADVADRVSPAVVHIERVVQGYNPLTGKDVVLPESNGSGFLVREDGLILTNAHVVGNKTNVKVRLQDGRSFQGEVQAVDRISDLATVKINGNNLPVLKLGKSASMRPGEWVVAIGSPLTLSNTVTHGIVSTTQRKSGELGIHGKSIEYIQTDATIDVGNSGGPLVNLDGEAIGINTLKVTAGISFAIPSDYASQFLEKANSLEKRQVNAGWFGGRSKSVQDIVEPKKTRYLGIRMLSLTQDIVRQLKNRPVYGIGQLPQVEHGVLIVGVIHSSPAHKRGLQPGDVITAIDKEPVTHSAQIYNAVDTKKNFTLDFYRGDVLHTITVEPETSSD